MTPLLTEPAADPGARAAADLASYRQVRGQTAALCAPLEPEDLVIQSMPDASPVKWHLAHTTWFFETFVLAEYLPGYRPFHPLFRSLFNSYYEAVGPRWARPQRGLLSRPTAAEVFRYREHVDEHMERLLGPGDAPPEALSAAELGLHHEQQHQELIVTDLKHAWALNPLRPVYRPAAAEAAAPADGPPAPELRWLTFPESLVVIGHDGPGFCFDNERPPCRVFLNHHRLANRLVTAGEYLEFMADGGYDRPELWLSEGWAARQAQGWTAPLYWLREGDGGEWQQVTLAGLRPVEPAEPVCHVSYFEADAYARWAGARLPTEAEWESAASMPGAGHYLESGRFHPSARPAAGDDGPLMQMYGDVWQWTGSAYLGYPGYRPSEGALGEYNGKFMCNQFVLRGASCATPRSHARISYRNFFPPGARWQFTGIRLAQEI